MLFKTSLLAALLAGTFGAHAAGLGKLTVYSAIGQPLNAELALNASAEEMRTLSAKIASHEAFKDAGIDYMPVLTSVRFAVDKSAAGQPVVRLTSDKPVNEPFLHFLVELNWTAGRMVREYTFLLDPPEMVPPSKPASVVAPATPKVPEAVSPGTIAPRETAPAAPVAGQPTGRTAGEVQVKSGDTLSKIAREHKSEAVSLDQMLVALFNSNREAFIGNNMNRLRAGKILRLPEESEAAGIGKKEARQMVVAQAADFNAYRRRLAEAAGAAPVAEAPIQQQAAGKITPRVEEKAPPAKAGADKLEVSRTETAKGTAGGKGKLEEELVAREKALREASERIAQLEKNLDNLKQLAELKSQAGAQMQQQAKAAAPTPAPAAAPAKEQKPEPAAAKPAEPVPAAQPAAPAGEAPTKPAEAPAAAPAQPAEAPKPAEPPKPEAKKPVPPPPPPPPEPSFAEENPEMVFGAGALIALLLGYFGFNAWRKKKQAAASFAESEGVPVAKSAAKFEAAETVAPAATPTEEISVLGDFTGGSLTEESIDPVAEADVLMAYGRDRQAEEILLEGLKTDSTRTAIYAKLLELYANRKDGDKFEAFAGDLHGLTGGEGVEWARAVTLAQQMGLSGGMFGAAAAPAEPLVVAAAPVVEAAPAAPAAVEMAAPELAMPTEAESAPAPEVDSSALDFDLDLGTTSMPAATAAAEQAAAQPAAEEAMALDFDFDLGTPAAAETAASVPAAAPVAEAAPAGNEISFDLDLGSGPGAVETPVPAVVEAPAVSTGALDFDLDLGSAEPAPSVPAAAVPALELPDISLDLEVPASSAGAAVDLSLPELAAPAAVASAAGGTDNPEAATKLELAQAYEEMGDREGARELLNEVLGEGSPAQQEQARARLDQLSV